MSLKDQLAEGLRVMLPQRATPEERLLAKRERKRRGLHKHTWTYLFTGSFLALMNTWTIVSGDSTPWALFALGGWGIGLGLHHVSFRDWLRANGQDLAQAERTLGRLPAAPERKGGAGSLAYVPIDEDDREWDRLVVRAKGLLDAAKAALEGAGPAGKDVQSRLAGGTADLDRLTSGQRRVKGALRDLGGGDADHERRELKARIMQCSDERLRRLYEANLGLLEARQTKVRSLREDLERMRASVQGFVLAAENIRLDAARLHAPGEMPNALSQLGEPLDRLAEEVEILRQVEAELERV